MRAENEKGEEREREPCISKCSVLACFSDRGRMETELVQHSAVGSDVRSARSLILRLHLLQLASPYQFFFLKRREKGQGEKERERRREREKERRWRGERRRRGESDWKDQWERRKGEGE